MLRIGVEQAGQAAQAIFAGDGSRWSDLLQFAAQIGVNSRFSFELAKFLVAGGWRSVATPEAWLKAACTALPRRRRVLQAKRARRFLELKEGEYVEDPNVDF